MSEPESVVRLQELLARLEATLADLEGTEDSEVAVEKLSDMAELAKQVQSEIDRARREGPDAVTEELRDLVERFLGELPFTIELGSSRKRSGTRSWGAASASALSSAWPPGKRSAATPRKCYRPHARSSSSTRSASSTTTCRRSTTTI